MTRKCSPDIYGNKKLQSAFFHDKVSFFRLYLYYYHTCPSPALEWPSKGSCSELLNAVETGISSGSDQPADFLPGGHLHPLLCLPWPWYDSGILSHLIVHVFKFNCFYQHNQSILYITRIQSRKITIKNLPIDLHSLIQPHLLSGNHWSQKI
jgi:hypothetical protein